MSRRTAFLITISALLAGAGMAVLSGCAIVQILLSQRVAPAQKLAGGVRLGSALLSKHLLKQYLGLGVVTDIAYRRLDANGGIRIGIAGDKGAILCDRHLTPKSYVKFNHTASHVQFVDVSGNGVCEYLDRGGHGWQDAHLFDHQGRLLWTCSNAPNDMAPGDLYGDGKLEFVTGYNGGGGVHLKDSAGHDRWSRPDGNVWHVEVVPRSKRHQAEIVHSNAAGQMTIRDATGKVLKRIHPAGPYFASFTLCSWPNHTGEPSVVLVEGNQAWLLDLNGRAIRTLNAPQCGRFVNVTATAVNLSANQPPYLAVATNSQIASQGILYVYNPNGTLVYQEVLPQPCEALAALEDGTGAVDNLLVGGTDRVWAYSIAHR